MNPFGVNVSVIYSSLGNPLELNIHLENTFSKGFYTTLFYFRISRQALLDYIFHFCLNAVLPG